MELYDKELGDALARLSKQGRNPDDFVFSRTYLPPDPDGGGMFTVRYEVDIRSERTSKSLVLLGGIGLRWVDQFEYAIEQGAFD